jgi:glyoxylase-like metal-dependent hydrolase (beta-lactamase superfamily II)
VVTITGLRQHESWQARTIPPVEEVRDGLWSVPVPLPGSPVRYVLCYAFVQPDERLVLLDTGWDDPPAWNALVTGLAATGLGVDRVSGVIITHLHPDHFGLATRVQQHTGAWVAMHHVDIDIRPSYGAYRLVREGAEPVRQHSLPQFTATVRLRDGDLAPIAGWNLRAMWTPGHTGGHICLHETNQRVLFSGDHVLPRISPNVGVRWGDRDALGDYLRSLEKVAALDVDEVMPAHEYRFTGLAERTKTLRHHHEVRVGEVVDVLRQWPGGCTARMVAERLTWSREWVELDPWLQSTAADEARSHLLYLRGFDRVGRLPRGEASEDETWVLTESA